MNQQQFLKTFIPSLPKVVSENDGEIHFLLQPTKVADCRVLGGFTSSHAIWVRSVLSDSLPSRMTDNYDGDLPAVIYQSCYLHPSLRPTDEDWADQPLVPSIEQALRVGLIAKGHDCIVAHEGLANLARQIVAEDEARQEQERQAKWQRKVDLYHQAMALANNLVAKKSTELLKLLTGQIEYRVKGYRFTNKQTKSDCPFYAIQEDGLYVISFDGYVVTYAKTLADAKVLCAILAHYTEDNATHAIIASETLDTWGSVLHDMTPFIKQPGRR